MKTARYWFTLELLIAGVAGAYAQPALEKLWETEATISVPESVLFDKDKSVLYVSQIDGKPAEKDGKGGIAKVGLDGKIVSLDWVTGLNAPKGLGKYKNKLYVADVDEVVVIDIASGKVLRKISVPGSKFLNDVTVDKSGNVYISDSQNKKVYLLNGETVTEFYESPERPNGLLAVEGGLLVLDNGNLYRVDKNKQAVKLAEGMEKSTDGIEEVKPGEYLVSCWAGVVYHVKKDGTVTQLLETKSDGINSADIGYDAKKRVVYIPTFGKNSVAAYQLK